jgi:sugar phosphate isomerase/epimerase
MARRYSVAHLTCLSWTPPEMIYNAYIIGYDCVSLRTISQGLLGEINHDISRNNELFRLTKQALNDTCMTINDIELAKIDANTGDVKRYEPHLDAAARLGIKNVITNIWTNNEDFYTEKFAELCDLAASFDISVNLEFVTWAEVKDLQRAMRLINAVKRKNALILLDTLHFYRSKVTLEELRSCPRDLFKTVHICDAEKVIPTDKKSLIHTGRAERLYVGEGAIDIAGIVNCLNNDVLLCLEMPHIERVKTLGATEHVRRSLVTAKKYFMEHGIY